MVVRFTSGGGAHNPYTLNVSVDCHAAQSGPSLNPDCLASGSGSPVGSARGRASIAAVALKGRTTVRPGRTGKLRLKVTKAGKRLFKPGKTVRVKVTVVTRQGADTTRATKVLKLKAPKKRQP